MSQFEHLVATPLAEEYYNKNGRGFQKEFFLEYMATAMPEMTQADVFMPIEVNVKLDMDQPFSFYIPSGRSDKFDLLKEGIGSMIEANPETIQFIDHLGNNMEDMDAAQLMRTPQFRCIVDGERYYVASVDAPVPDYLCLSKQNKLEKTISNACYNVTEKVAHELGECKKLKQVAALMQPGGVVNATLEKEIRSAITPDMIHKYADTDYSLNAEYEELIEESVDVMFQSLVDQLKTKESAREVTSHFTKNDLDIRRQIFGDADERVEEHSGMKKSGFDVFEGIASKALYQAKEAQQDITRLVTRQSNKMAMLEIDEMFTQDALEVEDVEKPELTMYPTGNPAKDYVNWWSAAPVKAQLKTLGIRSIPQPINEITPAPMGNVMKTVRLQQLYQGFVPCPLRGEHKMNEELQDTLNVEGRMERRNKKKHMYKHKKGMKHMKSKMPSLIKIEGIDDPYEDMIPLNDILRMPSGDYEEMGMEQEDFVMHHPRNQTEEVTTQKYPVVKGETVEYRGSSFKPYEGIESYMESRAEENPRSVEHYRRVIAEHVKDIKSNVSESYAKNGKSTKTMRRRKGKLINAQPKPEYQARRKKQVKEAYKSLASEFVWNDDGTPDIDSLFR